MLTDTLVNLNTLFIIQIGLHHKFLSISPKTQLKNYLSYKLGVVSHACDSGTVKLKARQADQKFKVILPTQWV